MTGGEGSSAGMAMIVGLGLGVGLGVVGRMAFSKLNEKETKEATPSSEDMLKTARENFQIWNDALQTGDQKVVASLYSDSQLSFLPTVSPKHIKDLDGTEDYFKVFVAKNPFGSVTDEAVLSSDNGNTYLHSGMYTFELGPSDSRIPVKARFSYVWRKEGSVWKIGHHHSSVCPTAGPPPAEDMLQIARTNFKSWNDALQTKDNAKVANHYSTSSLSFLPTVSPKHITGPVETADYFKAFVARSPFGTITNDQVQTFDNGTSYLHSGLYTFDLGPVDSRQSVHARFSYVWKKEGNHWKITHHHSSVRPA